jgi:hypothetical protein
VYFTEYVRTDSQCSLRIDMYCFPDVFYKYRATKVYVNILNLELDICNVRSTGELFIL